MLKKLLLIGLSGLMVMLLACDKENVKPQMLSPESEQVTDEVKHEGGQFTCFYGRISQLTDNELELQIIKDPFVYVESSDQEDESSTEDEIDNLGYRIEENETGEKISIEIPDRAFIFDFNTTEEIPLSDFDEGSIIMITFDHDANEVGNMALIKK